MLALAALLLLAETLLRLGRLQQTVLTCNIAEQMATDTKTVVDQCWYRVHWTRGLALVGMGETACGVKNLQNAIAMAPAERKLLVQAYVARLLCCLVKGAERADSSQVESGSSMDEEVVEANTAKRQKIAVLQ
jgi:hypothetical protein